MIKTRFIVIHNWPGKIITKKKKNLPGNYLCSPREAVANNYYKLN